MKKENKSRWITWIVFVISWFIGYMTGDGDIDEWYDYIPFVFFLGGLTWLIGRVFGLFFFKSEK